MAPLSTDRRVRIEYACGRSRRTLVCVLLALLLAVVVAAKDESPTPTPTPTFPSDNIGSASNTPAPTFPTDASILPTPAASTPSHASESSSSHDGDVGGPMTEGTSALPFPTLLETNTTNPPVANESRELPSPTTTSVPVDTSLSPSPIPAANASSSAPAITAEPEATVGDREAALVSAPYRSEILRCAERECQNEFVGEFSGGGGGGGGVCVSQLTSGSCPAGFNRGVATSSYKLQVLPNAPNSVADVTFSLLASDIAGALHNVGDVGETHWWLAFRLPPGWRFVTWGSTTVDVALVPGDGEVTIERQFRVLPCREITDAANCWDTTTGTEGDTVGFVAVQDIVGDWAALLSSSVKAPLTFRLEKSVVSGPTTSSNGGGQVGVFIVYEKQARTASRSLSFTTGDASLSTSGIGVSGNLAVVPLANMAAPAITEGRLYSSLLWVEVQKQKATLSFSTSTIIGSKSNEPKVCVNLLPTACSTLGRLPTANATFDLDSMAWYVKDGNPFIGMYTVPGDAPLTVELVNETFFCVRDLMPSGIDFIETWEVQREFKFQLYVKGITWLGSTAQNLSSPSDSSILPMLAEIMLIDRGVTQGSDCAQVIVHDQSVSNHGLSVYSVMSVTIYAVAFVGAVLITRMNGITFSAPTFYNDMTSVCVVVIFLLSIVGNAIWITVSSDGQSTNASHIYYLTRVLTACFTWTMMTSVCFHWSTVLNHDVRRIRRMYLMLVYITINAAFFACGLFVLISLSDFFKCAYDDYLKNPKYDKRKCDADYCPDLQPLQWKYAASRLCRAVPYSNWYFATAFSAELLMFLASLALLVLGTYVLQRGSRLIEHSGAILDDRIVTVMRNSLKTYLIVILAITISLGVSMAVNLVLYFGDWSINAIVWYTFTIWLPTLIPPAGFLVLQWNPRLHGISWSNGGGSTSDPQQPQSLKNRRDTRDDELKSALGRGNSTLGLLSDGWCGISEFPDTDYLPIGTDSCHGSSQQLLTLSAQLVTPVALHHTCYMELYVGEPQEGTESKDEFDVDVTGRPRGSISTMIQSGLLRESMIVSHTSNVNRGTRGNSTVLGSMQPTGAISWNSVGFTETVLPTLAHDDQGVESQVATFMSVIQIPALPPSAIVRFVVYELPDDIHSPPPSSNAPPAADHTESRPRAVTDVIRPPSVHPDGHVTHNRASGLSMARQSRTRAFCEFTCSSTVLANSEQLRLVAQDGSHRRLHDEQEANAERGGGDVPILRVRTTTVTTRTLKESSSFYITKCFQFADGDEMVVEDMTESIFTNEIPRQFLELVHKERSADLARAEHDLRAFEARCQRGLAAGLYDNLIDQIQGENVQTVAHSWLETRVRQRSAYLHSLKQCQQLCVDRAEEGLNFKASTEKKNPQLRFLPINLHIQDMWVGATEDLCSQLTRRTSTRVKLYTGVTVGAFAAHYYKFRHGVGILSMRARLAKKIPARSASDRVLLTRIDSGQSDKSGPLASPGLVEQELDWTETTVRAEDELRWQIVTRMDMCLSQGLTALVTSFCRTLEAALQHPSSDKEFLHIIDGVGFLWQVESLLSTHGKELGMLEDFSAAVGAMKGVSFVLDTSPPTHLPPTLNLHIKDVDLPSVVSVRLSGDTRSGHFIVHVGIRCRQDVVASLPAGIRDGGHIAVTPVLFTQGINEMQTLANGSSGKKTTLQQTINRDSFFTLKEYAEQYRAFASRVPGVVRTDMRAISSLLSELEDRILSAGKQVVKTKHPKIIQQSSRLCRLLGGGRVTSCKSAKDRTSMSVTLEQGQILCDLHGLPAEYMARTVSTMRSNGVRLENAFKNTGKRQYAFNALQRSLLPEEYKCPEGTYGRGNVS